MEARIPAGHSEKRSFRFGPFLLEPAKHILLEADEAVHIGARALDLLIALVERAGEVVNKEDLFARVWPDLTVDEGNLRAQIAQVRKALRDGRAGARYVKTVPGRGYCFVASVSATGASERIGPGAPQGASSPSIPIRLTPLIGRSDAVNDITGRFARHRLVTIIGPGGIGKTSVAMAVAEQSAETYTDGLCVVDCAPLLGESFVARRLASTLGLEISTEDPTGGLIAFLSGKRMLIVLDCCERVVGAAAILVEELLRGTAGVTILATSREPLRAEGEIVYRLPPLDVPTVSAGLTASEALAYPAVQLFVERVASSVGEFELSDADAPVVAEICRGLDGIALAIELAAGRVGIFGLLGVASRLEDSALLLTHGRRTALPRHQTLTATLDWSYDGLLQSEQATLRRLAVFAGSFGLDGAGAVAADALNISTDEIVASLASKSLINVDNTREIAQYRLLDTTRAYALSKLTEAGEFNRTAQRHAEYIRHLLERASADADASGPGTTAARLTAESKLVDEARAAIGWAFSTEGDVTLGIALTIACVPLWTHLSLNGECCRYAEQALLAGVDLFAENDRRQMQLLAALGSALVWTKGAGPAADASFTDALGIAERLDDTDYQIRILWGLWSSHFNSGRIRTSLDTAKRFRDIAAESGDVAATLVGERTIGMSLFYLGDNINARHHAESMLRHYSMPIERADTIARFQFDPRIVCRTLLAKTLWSQGFPDRAMAEVHGVLAEASSVGHAMSLALTLAQGACPISLLCGDLDAAEQFIGLLLTHTRANALDLWHAWALCFNAMLTIARGDTDNGLRELKGAIEVLPRGAFFAHYAGMRAVLAEALGRAGEMLKGHEIIDEAILRSERDSERWYVAEFLRVKGELLRFEGTPAAAQGAEDHFRLSLDCAKQQSALSWQLRTSTSFSRLLQTQGRATEANEMLQSALACFTEGHRTADLRAAKALLDGLHQPKGPPICVH